MQPASKGSAAGSSGNLIGVLLLNFICGGASGVLQLAVPLYALSLHATTFQLGLVAGVSGLGRILIILPSGVLVDRVGARRLFLHSTAWCSLCALALIPVSNPWLLMAVLFFHGMAQSVSFLALQAGFLKRLPYLPAGQAGWQRGFTQLGFYLVGPVLGGFLLEGHGYRRTFVTIALLFGSAWCISVYRMMRGIPEMADSATDRTGSEWQKMRLLLADGVLCQVLLIECFAAATFMVFRAFAAPVTVEALHLPVRAVSAVVMAQGSAAMAGLFLGGRFGVMISRKQVLGASCLLVLGGMSSLSFAGVLNAFVAGSIIYGVGTGLLGFCSMSRLAEVQGEKGKIAALFSMSIAIGNVFGPVAGGIVGDVFSVKQAFLAPAGFMTFGILVFVGLRAQAGWNEKKSVQQLKRGLTESEAECKSAIKSIDIIE